MGRPSAGPWSWETCGTWRTGSSISIPTIAIGGPGVNNLSDQLLQTLPAVWTQDQRLFVHADFDGDLKRACLWGADAAATAGAVEYFVTQGILDDLLRRIWRFRSGVLV